MGGQRAGRARSGGYREHAQSGGGSRGSQRDRRRAQDQAAAGREAQCMPAAAASLGRHEGVPHAGPEA
eukprot:1952116-Prorocentrum_lima.AAC.1